MKEDNYIRAGGNSCFAVGLAQYITKDRERWREIGDALCPIGDEEEKSVRKCIENTSP
jgi:hypothetical protein